METTPASVALVDYLEQWARVAEREGPRWAEETVALLSAFPGGLIVNHKED